MIRKNVLTKPELLDILNEKCRNAKLFLHGGIDDLGDECGGIPDYFKDEDIKEDNRLSFTVEAFADTAKGRNKLKSVFESIAKERRVAFAGRRSSLEIEKCENSVTQKPYWSFTWYFSPNE